MSRYVDPGSLKDWVAIEERSGASRTDSGASTPDFVPVESGGRPCRITNASGAVVSAAATAGYRVSVVVTMRRDELTEKLLPLQHRLVDDEGEEPRIFNVTDVRPHPDREYVDVYASLEAA